jgi:CheY-like chemotaxis protein
MYTACGHEPIHVLVVEDDVVSRDVACQMLSHFGHRASAVECGADALAFVRETDCDLVLMDYRMLDMDGLETTRRMRAGEAGPRGLTVPIIALTAQAFVADRDACLAAGMNDFLSKPVMVDSLVSAVERWGRCEAELDASDAPFSLAPTGPAAGAPAVFDPSVLAALPMVADGSQPEYGEVVLDLFFKSMPQTLASIRQAAAGRDTQSAQHVAHTLKSSSAAVGAFALAACAARAEAHLRAGHTNMSHLPSQFDMEFERLCTMLGRQHAPPGVAPTC